MAVAFLPVFYSHLALNDVPTLAPLTLSLCGTAACCARARPRLPAGGPRPRPGLRHEVHGGIVIVPLLAAAVARLPAPAGRAARARRALLAGALTALAAFIAREPLLGPRLPRLPRAGAPVQPSRRAQGKLGRAPRGRRRLLPVGLHLGPGLGARAGGARRCGRGLAPRPAGRLGAGADGAAFLIFMGLQGRYFGRWVLPIFPIACLLAAFARGCALAWGRCAPRPRRAALRWRSRPPCWRAALCWRRASCYSVHSGRVMSRPDTSHLARAAGCSPTSPRHARSCSSRSCPTPGPKNSRARGGARTAGTSPHRATCVEARRHARRQHAHEVVRRKLRAHAHAGADRLLRATRLLLGRERLDPAGRAFADPRPCRGRSPTTARSRQTATSSTASRPTPRRAPGRLQLRLELRLLPARLRAAGPGDDDLPAARRALRAASRDRYAPPGVRPPAAGLSSMVG